VKTKPDYCEADKCILWQTDKKDCSICPWNLDRDPIILQETLDKKK